MRDVHPSSLPAGVTVASAYSPAFVKVTLSSRNVLAIRVSYALLLPSC